MARRQTQWITPAITVNTHVYEGSHGKKPRGYGLWAFELVRNGAYTPFRTTGTYGDALRRAKREAKALGCDTVVTQP